VKLKLLEESLYGMKFKFVNYRKQQSCFTLYSMQCHCHCKQGQK